MSQHLKNPTSCQSGHCFICSAEIVKTNMNSHRRKCERFCILVGRYLNLNVENNSKLSNFKFDFKTTLNKHCSVKESEVICCESCFVEVEMFCVVFEQFSLIQLELNTRLNKIAQLIKNKNLCDETSEALQRKTDYVEKFRNAVVSRVKKGYKNFPLLQLTNLKRDLTPKTESEPIRIQLPQEKAKGVTKGVVINQETVKTSWRLWPKLNSKNLPFKCRICGDGFAKKSYRRIHERRHLKPHSCRFCARRFTHKVTLDTHEKLHTDIASSSQFMCCVCKKCFLRINDCKSHITKVHNKVGKIFKIMKKPKSDTGANLPLPPSNLKAGDSVDKQRIIKKGDNEDKPFKCPMCDKRFSQRQLLLKHQIIHNEARPFKCPYCEQTFKRSHNLAEHKRTHFGIKPFQCGLCGVKFRRASHCRVHQKKVHGVTDGVIIRENVDVPNETENFPSSSAAVSEGLLLHPSNNPATESEDQCGLISLQSIKEDIGGYDDNLPGVVSATDGVEMEQSETPIHLPKSEALELEVDNLKRMEADLCDPLADV